MAVIKPQTPIINWGNPLTNSLRFALPMFEGGGGKTKQVGPLIADGTFSGSPAPTWKTDLLGSAIKFDGSTGYVDVGLMGSFWSSIYSTGISISFLVKESDTSAIRSVIGFINTGTTSFYQINLNANQAETLTAGGIHVSTRDQGGLSTTGGVNANTGVTNGNWHHVIATTQFTNNTLSIYLDGVSQAITYQAQTSPTNFANAGFNVAIGARNVRGVIGRFMTGSLASVCIWNRILSPAEARSLYTNPWQIYQQPKFNILDAISSPLAAVKSIFQTTNQFFGS